MTAPVEELLLREKAARKDPAVHVSLSSDSPVKQPGNLAVSASRYAEKPTKLKPPTSIGGSVPAISEELRRRVIAPVSGRRAVSKGYMAARPALSTSKPLILIGA
jgi:hypothetical protein